MAEVKCSAEKPNGVYVELVGDEEDSNISSERIHHHPHREKEEVTLYVVFNRLIASIFSSNQDSNNVTTPLVHRIKNSVSESAPLLQEAIRNTGCDILVWTRRGSPFRALLVVSIGTITFLALTGLLAFVLFLIVATLNAIAVSILLSLAVVGGFLALLFAFLSAVYIGTLCIAVFVISTITISAITAALVASGWIGFFWMAWIATQKSVSLAKHFLAMLGSVVQANFSTQQVCHNIEPGKLSD